MNCCIHGVPWDRGCYACGRLIWERPFVPTPMGCICPPTSEQTCQNPSCPRKAPR